MMTVVASIRTSRIGRHGRGIGASKACVNARKRSARILKYEAAVARVLKWMFWCAPHLFAPDADGSARGYIFCAHARGLDERQKIKRRGTNNGAHCRRSYATSRGHRGGDSMRERHGCRRRSEQRS